MTDAKKWRPIILKDWEVRAILERRKTQLRRPITKRHARRLGLDTVGSDLVTIDGPYWDGTFNGGVVPWSPFGSPGDRIWGRETWWQRPDDGVIVFNADGNMSFDKSSMAYRWGIGNIPCPNCDNTDLPKQGFKKRPSTQMPRWASRISLEIESIRVEQVKEISEEDAKAEGINAAFPPGSDEETYINGPGGFKWLWESTYGPGSWDDNDWVWVATFRLLDSAKADGRLPFCRHQQYGLEEYGK